MNNPKLLLFIFAGYYYFLILGCFNAIRGFLLPQIKDNFNINYTTSGLMIVITALPGFIVSLFSGYIFTSVNKKFLLIFSSAVVFISFLLIPCSNSYLLFLIFSLFMGLGSFIFGTGANISIIDSFDSIKPKYKDNAVVLIHFIYSLGSSLVLLSGSLFKYYLGWRHIYFLLGIAFAIIPFILFFSSYRPVKDFKTDANNMDPNVFFSLIFNKKMIFYSICVFFYGGLEICLISWVPTFLERGFNLSITYSSMTMLVFFILYCVGRLFGVLIIHRMDKLKLLMVVLFLSMICLIAGLIFRIRLSNIDIFISITGFFFSIIFPAIQNLVTADFKKDLEVATSIILIVNASGSSLLSFITGVMNDFFTAKYGIIFICIFFIFIIPFLVLAVKSKNNHQGERKAVEEK